MGEVKTVEGRLVERIKRTACVESFRFILGEKSEFLPGQFAQVLFDREHFDNKQLNKYLSFSSSPAKNYIECTKRLSESEFSKRLQSLGVNEKVLFKLPLGNCVFKPEYKKIAFLVGGIGITPVISIIEYIFDKNIDTDIVLFYSNRTDEDIAFRQELDSWHYKKENIEIFYLVTDCQPKDNKCFFGKIDKDFLTPRIKDWKERVIFNFGPPPMVDAMKSLCQDLSCRPENLKVEKFLGY